MPLLKVEGGFCCFLMHRKILPSSLNRRAPIRIQAARDYNGEGHQLIRYIIIRYVYIIYVKMKTYLMLFLRSPQLYSNDDYV